MYALNHRPFRLTLVSAALLLMLPALAQEAQPVPMSDVSIDLELVAEGFTAPLKLLSPPDGSKRLFVLDQIGLVHVLTQEGERLEEPFLDLTDSIVELREAFDERGILGFAFHPNYARNGQFYVHYSAPAREEAPADWDHTGRISEFKVSQDDANVANADSERVLLEVDQPQFNHNGGSLVFGPDGYLYIALGDGGAGGDTGIGHPPQGHGQDVNTLLGSILRIDVDRGWPGYGIPQDNPFVGQDGRDEIYAWGLRNPYRISFDPLTGDLLAADVGQWLWEEVNLITEPGNFGWNIMEGTHCFDPENQGEVPDHCASVGPRGEPLIDPVIEYMNTGPRAGVALHDDAPEIGTTVIGGHVYRGSAIPELFGRYVFGDWTAHRDRAAGRIFVATPTEREGLSWPMEELHTFDGSYLLSIGRDADNELYALVIDSRGPAGESGRIYRIVSGDVDGM